MQGIRRKIVYVSLYEGFAILFAGIGLATLSGAGAGTSTALDTTLTAIASRFTCTREVATVGGRVDMEANTLTVAWNGVDGRPHSLQIQTRYARNGLSDYFYVAL